MQTDVEHKLAGPPFDNLNINDPKTGHILCTSDNVTFRLCNSIMAEASPVFGSMLVMPHPAFAQATSEEYIDGLPVVRVTEDSHIMDRILRCCHPIPYPDLEVSDIFAVYKAGEKYEAAAVMHHTLKELDRMASQSDTCLRAYAIACALQLRKQAAKAAKQSLHVCKANILHVKFPELDIIPASAFINLLDYRERCLHAIARLCSPEYWINLERAIRPPLWVIRPPLWVEPSDSPCRCDPDDPENDSYWGPLVHEGGYTENEACYIVKKWCAAYLYQVATIIRKDEYHHRHAIKNAWYAMDHAIKTASECDKCRPDAFKALVEFMELLEASVDRVISEVPFKVAS